MTNKQGFAYMRASNNDLRDQSLSIQQKLIKEKARMENIQIVKWFSDSQSGLSNSNSSAGLASLFKFLNNNPKVEFVVIESEDRLGRDKQHARQIIHRLNHVYNVSIIFVRNSDTLVQTVFCHS